MFQSNLPVFSDDTHQADSDSDHQGGFFGIVWDGGLPENARAT